MKALGISERLGLQRYVSQQIHYTLQAREAEYELVPLAVDQDCPILVWSPLAGGLLSGKYRRDEDASEGRHVEGWDEPPVCDDRQALRHHRGARRDRRRIAASRRPRWPSRGCSGAPASPRSSSAPAPTSS